MIISFFIVIALNLTAYLTIIRINKAYGSVRNTAESINSKMINANLVFQEVRAQGSGKDMNAVWSIFDSVEPELEVINGFDKACPIKENVESFKKSILDFVLSVDNPAVDSEKLQEAYAKSYADLSISIKNIESSLNEYSDKYLYTTKITFYCLIFLISAIFAAVFFLTKNFLSKFTALEDIIKNESQQLESIMDSVDIALVSIDMSQKVTHCNQAAEKLLCLDHESILGRSLAEILPSFRKLAMDFLKVVQLRRNIDIPKESFLINGIEKKLDIKIILQERCGGLLISMRDMTADELLGNETMHEQKMQIFKSLIKGLVHSFSGILSELIDTINIIEVSNKKESVPDVTFRHNMKLIEDLTERAYTTIQRLNAFSQERTCKMHPLDLAALIRAVLEKCNSIFDDDVEISASIPESGIFVNADHTLIELALLNICENASDAMTVMRPENSGWGGNLHVSLDKIYPDRTYREIHPLATDSSYWVTTVSDNGIGIERELLSKIFDPFFTTKEKATGTGLAIANEIIRNHRGFIEVYSQPGKGAKFIIFLPDNI